MNRIKFGPIDLLGCREALELLDDHLDNELPAEERKKVTTHLRICRFCAAKFRFEGLFLNEVRSKMNSVEMPLDVEEKVRIAIEEEKKR